MTRVFHILNGDALKSQLPNDINGACIVARECMVDGEVSGTNPEEIFDARSKFLSTHYTDVTPELYVSKTITEFEKIRTISNGSEINLWFEDDLFCQVNLWFVAFYALYHNLEAQFYLVRPSTELQYGFGGMSAKDLSKALSDRKRITIENIKQFAKLWKHYQDNNQGAMVEIGLELEAEFPFLKPAILAHIQRFPKGSFPGRPKQALLDIIDELQTNDFGQIFRVFNQRQSIYGFGDLQVKRIYNALTNLD